MRKRKKRKKKNNNNNNDDEEGLRLIDTVPQDNLGPIFGIPTRNWNEAELLLLRSCWCISGNLTYFIVKNNYYQRELSMMIGGKAVFEGLQAIAYPTSSSNNRCGYNKKPRKKGTGTGFILFILQEQSGASFLYSTAMLNKKRPRVVKLLFERLKARN